MVSLATISYQMIYSILQLIQESLQDFLELQFPQKSYVVAVDKLVTREGKSTTNAQSGRIVITLLHAQEERTVQRSRTSDLTQPYHLNLLLLFSIHEKEQNASGNAYLEAMKYLDMVLGYFQQTPVFSNQTHALPPNIQHLHFELFNEDLRENSYIWTMTGAKHTTSVLYQVRSVTVGQTLVGSPIAAHSQQLFGM